MIRTRFFIPFLIASSLFVTFGTQTAQGQSVDVNITGNKESDARNIAKAVGQQWYPHAAGTKTIAEVLRRHREYSTFLGLTERAGMLPLLNGAVQDTASALVAFRAPGDSTQPTAWEIAFDALDMKGAAGQLNNPGQQDELGNRLHTIMQEAGHDAAAQDSLLTVFAPTNAAFAKLTQAQLAQLTHDSATLVAFVRAHIVTKGIYATAMRDIRHVRSLGGSTLLFETDRSTGNHTVGGIAVLPAELVATNGVVHGLTAVLPWPTTALTSPRATP